MSTPVQEQEAPTTPSDEIVLPDAKELRRLKLSPEIAWYLLSRGWELPAHPPLEKTPDGSLHPDAGFAPEAVDAVVNALRHMRHTKGRLAGKPLNPANWQVAYIIAPIFGWLRPNDEGRWVRVVRTAFVEVPRKNGKSTIAGGVGLYLCGADDEPGAEIVAAAASKDQANFVFGPIKALAQKSPDLRGRFRPLTNRILHPASGSDFKVISSVGDTQHGANLHGAIIDEIHVHKTRDLIDALETGTGSRDQPLVLMITTAGDGKPNTIYAIKRRMISQLAKGTLKDPTTYGVVWGLHPRANPLAPKNWPIANPGYPISPTHDFLVSAAAKAKTSPAELALFKRLHAGMPTRQTTTYLDLKKWNRNRFGRWPLKPEQFAGREAYGGLDLGSVSDLTALCWLIPDDELGGYQAMWRFWAPEGALEGLDRRTSDNASKVWVPKGWLTLTPGDVTDYDWIQKTILEDAEHLEVTSIGLDMWNATQLANDLQDEGMPLTKVRQGFVTMSPALKEVLRRVLRKELRHDGNPVMEWCVDNLAVATDPAGNVKPDKASSADKIDGVSALCNAMSEALGTAVERSAYDDHDLLIV